MIFAISFTSWSSSNLISSKFCFLWIPFFSISIILRSIISVGVVSYLLPQLFLFYPTLDIPPSTSPDGKELFLPKSLLKSHASWSTEIMQKSSGWCTWSSKSLFEQTATFEKSSDGKYGAHGKYGVYGVIWWSLGRATGGDILLGTGIVSSIRGKTRNERLSAVAVVLWSI